MSTLALSPTRETYAPGDVVLVRAGWGGTALLTEVAPSGSVTMVFADGGIMRGWYAAQMRPRFPRVRVALTDWMMSVNRSKRRRAVRAALRAAGVPLPRGGR